MICAYLVLISMLNVVWSSLNLSVINDRSYHCMLFALHHNLSNINNNDEMQLYFPILYQEFLEWDIIDPIEEVLTKSIPYSY